MSQNLPFSAVITAKTRLKKMIDTVSQRAVASPAFRSSMPSGDARTSNMLVSTTATITASIDVRPSRVQ